MDSYLVASPDFIFFRDAANECHVLLLDIEVGDDLGKLSMALVCQFMLQLYGIMLLHSFT